MADVACVGILCADVLVKPVIALPEKGKLELVDHLQLDIGGCAANAAIDLARLGISTTLIGKVGADSFGEYLSNHLVSEGVDVRYLAVDPRVPTSASVVIIDGQGERTILHCSGANASFQFEDVNLEEVRRSKILFVAGVFLMKAFDGAGAARLLREAQNAGKICFCDTAWDSSGLWMTTIEGMLPYVDWLMPSFDEAVQLSGESDPELIAAVFKGKGVKNIVIKLGEKGCYVQTENEAGFFIPAFKDIPVIDTSGAGDSFCAGFIAGILKGFDARGCALLANSAGAQCVMQMGTTSGIRTMQETVRFIEEHNR